MSFSCLRSVFLLACKVGRRTVPLLNNYFGRKIAHRMADIHIKANE